ncbi:MAG: DUF3971 domain-containing protein [Alphaproteobacteria bacterium]
MLLRATKITIEVFAVLLTGAAIAIGAAAWRLSTGPVELEAMSPYVERALTPASGEFQVRIERTILTWGGWQRPVVVHAVGVRAIRPDGDLIARVPRATIRFSARALLRGKIAPTSLEIRSPSLVAERTKDGRFTFGLGGPGAAGDKKTKTQTRPVPLPRAVIEGLLANRRQGALSYLTSVRIAAAKMTIFDRHLALAWQAPAANLEFTRGPAGIRMTADLTVIIRGQEIQLRGAGIYGRESRTAEVTISFFGLKPSLFAQRDGETKARTGLNHLSALRIALDGQVRFALERDGRLTRMGFEVEGSKGTIVLPNQQQRELIISTLALRGRVGADFTKVTVDDLSIAFGRGPVLQASGTVENLGGRAKARVQVTMRNVRVNDLQVYWPSGVAESSRRWILANLSDGILPEASATVEAAFGNDEEPSFSNVSGAFLYGGLTVRYLKGLPPVRAVTGSGTFTEDRIDFRVASGKLQGLTVYDTTVKVTGMTNDDPRMQRTAIRGMLRGPLAEALKVIDSEPLKYASKVGVTPSTATGNAVITLDVEFPLLDALTFDEVAIKSQAELQNFSWRGGLYGLTLRGGALRVDVDKSEMAVRGRVRLGNQPARVNWVEKFGEKPKFRRQITIDGLADEEIRHAFGIVAAPFIQGPVRARVRLTKRSTRSAERVDARFDLRNAAMDLPFLGWSKPVGTPGTAAISVTVARGRVVAVNALSFDAAGLKATGSATMDKSGNGFDVVTLKRVVLGRTDVSLQVSARESGGYIVQLRGKSVDGERFFKGEINTKEGARPKGPRPDLALQFAVDRVYFGKSNYLSNLRGQAARIGGLWTIVHFDGQVPSGKPLRVRFAKRGPGRALAITSSDAGGTLKALGIVDNVVGGTLHVRGAIVDDKREPFAGRVTIKNYRLIKAPILRRITSEGSLEETAGALAKPRGVLFREFVAPFTYRHPRGALRVKNGRAISANLGVTFEGALDLRHQRLEIDGTVVPAYSLNSVLGKVPLLGQVLVGEKYGGVFAAAYTAEGPLRKPTLKVHPLSVLTPAFLRGLWRKFRDDAPQGALNSEFGVR